MYKAHQQDAVIQGLCTGNEVIDCNGLHLEDNGTKKLCNFLKRDRICKCVKLEWNEIWLDGAEAIAELLRENNTIHSLFLGHNNIQNSGLTVIADALKTNTGLATLYINDNHIGDQGVEALLTALGSNCSLKSVVLDCNIIEEKTLVERIQERLYNNRSNVKGNTPVAESFVNKSKELLEDEKGKNDKLNRALQTEKEQNAKLKSQVHMLTRTKQELHTKISSLEGEMVSSRLAVANMEQMIAAAGLSQKEKDAKHQQQVALLRKQVVGAEETNRNLQQRISEFTEKQKYAEKREKEISGEGLEKYDMQQLTFLEAELTASLNRVRNLKVQRLQQKVKELEDLNKCKICFDAKINIVLVPCGHHILCHVCSEKISKCPFCSAQIQQAVKTFEG